MIQLAALKKQRAEALSRAEGIVAATESSNRQLTPTESEDFNTAMAIVNRLDPEIQTIEAKNTIRRFSSPALLGGGEHVEADSGPLIKSGPKAFSRDYATAFHTWIKSGGVQTSAALYEGSNSGGGYAVPIVVDSQIVPLAPPEMGIRNLATVIPTQSDIKIPIKATQGAAAAKSEGDGTGSNVFTGTSPSLSQKLLSAFMAGDVQDASWELLQDVATFQAFIVDDLVISQQAFEENWYINGTGSAQPEGVVAHCDNGVAAASPDASGNLVSIDATFDLIATLKAMYHPGAAWLMQRTTAVGIRKAQRQANLFEPVFVRVGNQDYLHGYPVEYSSYMPAAAASATPILFGDFKRGYVIGDRGGSGINVRILDQPKAREGLTQFLAYRRTDGRVRRSEAIKSMTLHS